MTARFAGAQRDVRLVNRLATGVAAADQGSAAWDAGIRRVWPFWPLLILLCGAAVAVGAAMLREALTGPVGVFWWLGVVLAFFAGHRWELARGRERNRQIAADLHARFEARLHRSLAHVTAAPHAVVLLNGKPWAGRG